MKKIASERLPGCYLAIASLSEGTYILGPDGPER